VRAEKANRLKPYLFLFSKKKNTKKMKINQKNNIIKKIINIHQTTHVYKTTRA
jgi:hypothetical protein